MIILQLFFKHIFQCGQRLVVSLLILLSCLFPGFSDSPPPNKMVGEEKSWRRGIRLVKIKIQLCSSLNWLWRW